MAWAYCDKCGEQLGYPSPREIGDQSLICGSCGYGNDPRVSVGDFLEELNDRVGELFSRMSGY